jgi:DNA repair exonuclease SbcCD ATPase subunit
MSRPEHRISDDMASEVLAEAARLNMEANKGYSLNELEQAGLEVQISPKIIGQAIKIVEERRQADRVKQQRSKERFKQQVRKLTFVGFLLCIPVVLAVGMPIFLSEIHKITKLPDLQSRIQELENEKSQIQTKFENADKQLKLKNKEVDRLQQDNDKLIKEVRELQQDNARLSGSDTELKSGIMFRDSFAEAVVGKAKEQVIQSIGRPNRTSDSGEYSHWYYDGKTKDRVTGNLDDTTSIFFVDGIADKVSTY